MGNGAIHPVQEHVNTLGIDCSIQMLTLTVPSFILAVFVVINLLSVTPSPVGQ